MRRTRLTAFLVTLCVAVGVLVALTGQGGEAETPAPPVAAARVAPAARPNIVVLMTDDMRTADLPYLPRTRRLIGSVGVRFPRSISPHPLCCPARAEFLTAQYAQNNGVRSNHGAFGGYKRLDPTHTIATRLTGVGYRTAFMGKHLNGYIWPRDGRDPGWTVYNPLVRRVYAYLGWSILEQDKVRPKPGEYVTGYLASRASTVIRRFATQRPAKPFMLWMAYIAPHKRFSNPCDCWLPPLPAARDQGAYAERPLDTTTKPSYFEPDVSDKPAIIRAGSGKTPAEITRLFRRRIESLRAVDRANARIIDALRDSGQLRNTIVVFTSDNGFMLGEHRWDEKTLAFEESLAVPLFVRGPGVAVNQVSLESATTVDLATTLLAMAGSPAAGAADGLDLTPILADPAHATLARDTTLIQGGPRFTKVEDPWGWLYRGVRTDRYTYVAYGNGETEMYDRRLDPFELDNIVGDPAYAPVRDELASRVAALVDCAGRACSREFGPVPEPVPEPEPEPEPDS